MQNEMGATEKGLELMDQYNEGSQCLGFFLGLDRTVLESAGMSISFLSKVIIAGNGAERNKETLLIRSKDPSDVVTMTTSLASSEEERTMHPVLVSVWEDFLVHIP